MAMTYLLDDPSPRVRLALAEALAAAADAPRSLMVSLAEDQPEIACTVIAQSPVLTDADLVDLIGKGNSLTRALVASRPQVSRAVAAALVEVGDAPEVLTLLENDGVAISRVSLKRIAERHGQCCDIRNLLLERTDLPADARHTLVKCVSDALSDFGFVRAAIGARRVERVAREANEAATVAIAGAVAHAEIPGLVEHLRVHGGLTPAFLMHALCSGKVDFIAGALVNLSGLEDKRVRSILATGRMHAVRALFEAAGLRRDISTIFVEATLLWREAASSTHETVLENVSSRLLKKFSAAAGELSVATELMAMVEKLHIANQRQSARSYAMSATLVAA